MRSRTLLASHTKGRWISGMAISPDLTQLSSVSIRCWLTEYFCADIAYIPIFALDSKNDFHDYPQAANPNRTRFCFLYACSPHPQTDSSGTPRTHHFAPFAGSFPHHI